MPALRHYSDIMLADTAAGATYATRGHAATAPGLRGHSIGDLYPYTVVAIGAYPVQFAAMDLRTGRTGHLRGSYAAAAIDVAGLRVRNLIND